MKWTIEEEHLLRLLLPTNSYQEIAEEFNRRRQAGLGGFTTERSADAVRKKCDREELTKETIAAYENPYKDHWEKLKNLTKDFRASRDLRTVGLIESGKITTKILSISDLHVPFVRDELLQDILDEHKNADMVVVNGDLLDGYMFSTFGKAKRVAAHLEYQCGFEIVKYLSENFPLVGLVSGNHDDRPARALGRAEFGKECSTILRPDLLARIANGEEIDEFGSVTEKHKFDNVVYQKNESWYLQVGKTIFAHPHGWNSGIGGTVLKLDHIFSNRFGTQHYDSIVCGHTHRVTKHVNQNRLLIEQGSLSARLEYEHKPNLRMMHATNGYAVIYQDAEGNTDFNRSMPIYLGSELPPKKKIII